MVVICEHEQSSTVNWMNTIVDNINIIFVLQFYNVNEGFVLVQVLKNTNNISNSQRKNGGKLNMNS